jgi:transcriptional regulator with XRE-family HTH domain
MRRKRLETLGAMLRERRGDRTLRETAREIGIGPATMLRVESGRMPDVETFAKICQWLELDPATVLGVDVKPEARSAESASDDDVPLRLSAHFKADSTPHPDTISALAKMLLYAARVEQRVHKSISEPDENA